MQFLRQESPEIQDLSCGEGIRDNRPSSKERAGKQEQGRAEPFFKQDARVPCMRQAQEHSEKEKVADSGG